MHYREIQPNAAAARFVKCYWLLEDGEPSPSIQRVVPDGRAQLILNLGHPYEALTERGWQRQPRRFFIGQITAPLLLRATGPFRMIGINFHPHAASQLLRIPMYELTDSRSRFSRRLLGRIVPAIGSDRRATLAAGVVPGPGPYHW
ncbi:MAG TPA: DUF6597 domain-containing transcriptional factor [Terriglobales bacterium]